MPTIALAASVAISLLAQASADDAQPKQRYGTISGRFVFKGEVPKRGYVVLPGDQSLAKSCPMCAKTGIVSDTLIVDPKNAAEGILLGREFLPCQIQHFPPS